jgi:hypothetical protein
MNEMEQLWQVAQETPLPAPAELDAARARLLAAIAADAALPGTVVAGTADQIYPSGIQPVERPALRAPAPVLSAVKLMYGGAIGTAAQLAIALAYIGDIKAYHLTVLGHHLTTAQLSHMRPLIVVVAIAAALAVIGLWLWMARATGQGKNWARILSTVLLGLATVELTGNNGAGQLILAMLTWLTGLAAVCQLWRPASGAFFRPAKALRSRPPGQLPGS